MVARRRLWTVIERRLLFFGDSFVAGMGDPQGRGWVGRVVEGAAAAGVTVTPYNLGVRGETSVEVADRWWGEAESRVVVGADCRVVVAVGANDAVDPRVSPAASRRALESILVTAAELGLSAFVVGPGPIGEDDADARVLRLDAAFATLCADLDVPYVPVTEALMDDPAWTGEAAASDGTHPGAGGYAVLADLVLAGGFLDWLTQE